MGVYQEPRDFIHEVFTGDPPEPAALWITPALREPIEDILGHPPSKMRMRYWRRGDRTAWIVEEIGKEKPITTGFVIEQFREAALEPDGDLDRHIDSISGATLSVSAIKRLAKLTLFLDSQVRRDGSA